MNKPFTHVLQKTGVLKTFTVAKVVNKKEIDDLKKLIRSVTTSESEYKQLLDEELDKLSNMHDDKNPVPGIIYDESSNEKQKAIFNITKKFAAGIKKFEFSSMELAFLVTAIITELNLSQKDFESLKKQLGQIEEDDADSDDGDDGDEGDEEYDKGFDEY